MPWVNLSQYDDRKINIVDGDGTRGYLIGQHWTAWITYWVCAAASTITGIGGLIAAARAGWLPPITDWRTFVGAALVLYVVAHVDLLWYWALSNTYVLVTEKNVFVSQMRKAFFHHVNGHPIGNVKFITDEASWIFPVYSVDVLSGERLLLRIERASGGDEIEHAIETLRGEK